MRIIRRSESILSKSHERVFRLRDERGRGFSFDCDETGAVDLSRLHPRALENYRKCLAGDVDGRKVVDEGIREHESFHRQPAVGECSCGASVTLSGFTNTCRVCGADYNGAGQRLAPREQWGEETGEHPSEIY